MGVRFHGLTWDHPRGFNALAAAAEGVAPRGLLSWCKQPLLGFESHPIGDLAAQFDLLVLDHPNIGEAVALDCVRPLDQVFSPEETRHMERRDGRGGHGELFLARIAMGASARLRHTGGGAARRSRH